MHKIGVFVQMHNVIFASLRLMAEEEEEAEREEVQLLCMAIK